MKLDSQTRTSPIAWGALATVAVIMVTSMVACMGGNPNTAVFVGVGTAVLSALAWCVVFLVCRIKA